MYLARDLGSSGSYSFLLASTGESLILERICALLYAYASSEDEVVSLLLSAFSQAVGPRGYIDPPDSTPLRMRGVHSPAPAVSSAADIASAVAPLSLSPSRSCFILGHMARFLRNGDPVGAAIGWLHSQKIRLAAQEYTLVRFGPGWAAAEFVGALAAGDLGRAQKGLAVRWSGAMGRLVAPAINPLPPRH